VLTAELKAQRITTSIEMLRILQTQEPMNVAGVVTGDESWFSLEYFRNRVWTLGDINASEKVSQ
jgi:adenine deaminase